MKILILTNIGSGLYLFRKELLKTLVANGHKVYFSSPEDEYVAPLQEIDCTWIRTQFNRRGMNPFADIKLLYTYNNLCDQVKPDVVLTYTIKPNVYGGLVCRIKRIPYMVNVAGLGTAIENPSLLRKLVLSLYRIGLKDASCVFFQNETHQQFFAEQNIEGRAIRLLPGSGVNLDANPYEPYPDEDGTVRFLFVGRIMKDKGIEELLSCAVAIKRKYRNIQFHLAGSYDDTAYEETISRLEGLSVIHFYRYRSDIHALMAQHHAVIHPSYHEGLSNVLLEAAACGRPVIATNVPGCRETFDEGVSGFGVPARDSESLIAAVERFICLPHAEKAEMGRRGRKKVEQEFDRTLVVDAYLEEIQKT